jgi:hypothetical protein
VYDIQKTCYWLYIVEYANLNCQAAYNAAPDANGYKQGGLGNGVTTLNAILWNNLSGNNPFIPCGHTNSLGNRTGVVDFAMPAEYGATLTVQVPSYRGLENPFGHIFKAADGCKIHVQSNEAGGLSEFFVCNDPAKFQDSSYNDYEKRGELSRVSGYIKEMLIGEFGDNMTKVASGASSITYFCDLFHVNTPTSGEVNFIIVFGGNAEGGGYPQSTPSYAGLAASRTDFSAAYAQTSIGTRLCFIPEN